jgi:serine protease
MGLLIPILLLGALLAMGGTPAPEPPPRHEVIVRFDDGTTRVAAARTLQAMGGLEARISRSGRHVLVPLDPDVSLDDAVARLRRTPGVVHAEANGFYRSLQNVTFSPNDELFPRQWNFRLLDAERTWAIQKGNPSVVVAVIDTGIAYENFGPFRRAPDWGDTVFVQGLNTLTGSSHANDDHFHGTHVASTIAEATNNGEGVAGLAFGCALMPVKVLDHDGFGTFFDIADGIYYAAIDAPQKAKVVSLSLGGDTESFFVGTAIEDAVAAGAVVVAAAGNDGRSGVLFPARHPLVIAVGAVDGRKVRTPYSTHGPELDLVAPGGDVDRDDDGDGKPDGVLQQTLSPFSANEGRYDDFNYFYVDGTSQAVPHVSAAAALLISQGITSPQAVRAALEGTAEDLGDPGHDNFYGHGLIQPVRALTGLGLND